MEYIKLGKSDLNVSRICMGCMGLGNAATGQHNWTVDETQTREIIAHGLCGFIYLPYVGLPYADGAKAVDLKLTEDEMAYLEELYVPHALAGVMAQNGKQKAGNVV